MRRRRRFRFEPAIALLIAVASLAGGCSDRAPSVSDEARAPLLLFAVDGLEWSVLQPLLAAGKLPAIAALMERGSYGFLRSVEPTKSPVIWTTIATGKDVEQHGIDGFVYEERSPGSVATRYFTSGHRQTKAFWNVLSDYGLTVHCFGWWITYPVEPINGVMVSQTNTTAVLRNPRKALWKGSLLEGVEGQVYPPSMQNRIMELLAEVEGSIGGLTREIFGDRPHGSTTLSERLWSQTLWAFRADAVYIRALREVLASREPFDLAALYIGGADVAGHRFWRYAYPELFRYPPSREQIENFGELIDDYYRYIDRTIGEIVAQQPPDATVIVVSDHGMGAINTEVPVTASDPPQRTNSGHHFEAPPGVFLAAGPAIRRSSANAAEIRALDLGELREVGGILDVLPTILAIKALPLADDLEGASLADVLTPEWLERFPARRVATFDDEEWARGRASRITDAVEESERLEQLRSLGYIE